MSLTQITQMFSRLVVSNVLKEQVSQLTSQSAQRNLHTSSGLLKNFSSRIPPNIKMGKWRLEAKVDPEKYTLRPLPVAKTGGRGPDGRIWVHKVGGGNKVRYRMVDHKREGPKEGAPLVEKINAIRPYDPCRTAAIAVAVSGNRKRYIIASENMKVGDLVKTSGVLTAMPVRAYEGDSHPVGSLPLGTLVYNIERLPGDGGRVAKAAGTSGLYVRKIGDQCVIRMPSKREMVVAPECMVTVGRVSNPDHDKTKKMHKAGQNRWKGKRPCSGLWQRKDGRFGRKLRPLKAPVVYSQAPREKPDVFRYQM